MAVQDDDAYWHPGLETQSRADWRQLQLDLLKDHLRHAYDGSPYCRAAFDARGVLPSDLRTLDDLRRFPFLDKVTIRDRQRPIMSVNDTAAALPVATGGALPNGASFPSALPLRFAATLLWFAASGMTALWPDAPDAQEWERTGEFASPLLVAAIHPVLESA